VYIHDKLWLPRIAAQKISTQSKYKKMEKAATRGDARCLAVPHFSARRRAVPRSEVWHRVKHAVPRGAAYGYKSGAARWSIAGP